MSLKRCARFRLRRGRSSVKGDESIEFRFVRWANQVTDEEPARGGEHAGHFGKDCGRFGNVVNHGVRDDGGERSVCKGKALGIDLLKRNARLEPGLSDIRLRDRKHVVCKIHGNNVRARLASTQGKGDSRRPRSDIEHTRPNGAFREQIVAEGRIDDGVIHRVVIRGFVRRVHDLRFKNPRECRRHRRTVPSAGPERKSPRHSLRRPSGPQDDLAAEELVGFACERDKACILLARIDAAGRNVDNAGHREGVLLLFIAHADASIAIAHDAFW